MERRSRSDVVVESFFGCHPSRNKRPIVHAVTNNRAFTTRTVTPNVHTAVLFEIANGMRHYDLIEESAIWTTSRSSI